MLYFWFRSIFGSLRSVKSRVLWVNFFRGMYCFCRLVCVCCMILGLRFDGLFLEILLLRRSWIRLWRRLCLLFLKMIFLGGLVVCLVIMLVIIKVMVGVFFFRFLLFSVYCILIRWVVVRVILSCYFMRSWWILFLFLVVICLLVLMLILIMLIILFWVVFFVLLVILVWLVLWRVMGFFCFLLFGCRRWCGSLVLIGVILGRVR